MEIMVGNDNNSAESQALTTNAESMSQKKLILLSDDLMFGSTVSGYAANAGLVFQSIGMTSVRDITWSDTGLFLCIDLGTPGLDISEVAKHVPPHVLKQAVAYGPHVHTEKLAAAQAVGIGRVISRGQFSAQAGVLIAEFATMDQRSADR